MIGIVNYQMGNLRSVQSAFEYLGENISIINNPDELNHVDKVVLPGVGAFEKCKKNLDSLGFTDALNHNCIIKAKPTLGICLGMQIMATTGEEGGLNNGLNWFNGSVIKLKPKVQGVKIPNVGWEETIIDSNCSLFRGLPQNPVFYYVHSYYMNCLDQKDIIAKYDLTFDVTAAILKDNIFATQFHPEKSQDVGLKVLENFIKWNP